jgi:hypothetical protein
VCGWKALGDTYTGIRQMDSANCGPARDGKQQAFWKDETMNDSQAMVAQSAKLAKEARTQISLETYTEAVKALMPFAAMYRETDDSNTASSFYIARGVGCDRTVITGQNLKRAFEIVDAFMAQPENQEPDAIAGADEVFGDSN